MAKDIITSSAKTVGAAETSNVAVKIVEKRFSEMLVKSATNILSKEKTYRMGEDSLLARWKSIG